MDSDFWKQKWRDGQIGFHMQQPHALLQKYGSALRLPIGSTVLVPLCGKSPDLLYLAQCGYQVIGVEISEIAIVQFFNENQLTFRRIQQKRAVCFESGRIKLLLADFFRLEKDDYAVKIDAIYDRAALVALPEPMRAEYVRNLRLCLQAHAKLLLICVEYEHGLVSPPPFHVGEEVVAELFDDWCERYKLTSVPAKLKCKDIVECLYLLQSGGENA